MQDGDPPLSEDLELIVEVAHEAGDLAIHWLNKGAATWDKSPGNPVTEADIAVNDLIRKRLAKARPGYGWLSEETRDDPANRAFARTFVVDPIDGTRAFVRGEPGFCISIARLQGPEAVAGVLCNPLTKEVFAAQVGCGATLNGELIKASSTAKVEGCGMIVRPHIHSVLRMEEKWPAMRLMHDAPNSIAYRIALVAAGRWDAAIGLNITNDWDVAAAALIMTEAGGRITDREGKPFAFNQEITNHPGVVAAGAYLHPLLMEKLRELGRPS